MPPPPRNPPPPNGPPLNLGCQFCFGISKYLTDKYFNIVWGCHPPEDPPNGSPKKSIFWTAQFRVPVCFDIRRYLTDKHFGIVWGCHSPREPPNGPLKINFLNGSTYRASVLWYQELFKWQIFWLYFSEGSIIRYFRIIADLTVDKKYFWASKH